MRYKLPNSPLSAPQSRIHNGFFAQDEAPRGSIEAQKRAVTRMPALAAMVPRFE